VSVGFYWKARRRFSTGRTAVGTDDLVSTRRNINLNPLAPYSTGIAPDMVAKIACEQA